MKALVVRQPWASLIALGVKTIETRPSPPNGPMRPAGVRGLPGCRLERGERIAIVAGKDKACITEIGPLPWAPLMSDYPGHLREPLLLGRVICTVVVADAVRMVPYAFASDNPCLDLGQGAWLMSEDGDEYWDDGDDQLRHWWSTNPETGGGVGYRNHTDQIPFGDFAPGRWGWMLTDVEPCAPVPVKGRQGVFLLPDDVAEELS